ncbi:ladderlectin-like isoform X1 [Colossoma macropomum]|uniref:ladderlectin-like isoform X1 n=1 Tax=Colossoma macropomum TaxID=42526 RepID=UPI001864991F|nr:ladderlectin-like isoform X1 [Colossoma macropomum]
MKIWIVSVLLCAAFVLQTTEGAVVAEREQNLNEIPVESLKAENGVEDLSLGGEAGELSVEELVAAADDERQDSGPVNLIADRAVLCPPGWFRHGSRCFLLVRTTMTWLSAESHCVNNQASLASVRNPDEYNFLQSLLTIAGISTAWIGAYNFQSTWMWIDRAGFFYTNWQSLSSVSSYPCAYMRSTAGWANTNCGSGFAFFCSVTPTTC